MWTKEDIAKCSQEVMLTATGGVNRTLRHVSTLASSYYVLWIVK